MADGIIFPVQGGTKIASDDLGGGVQVQRMKVGFGPDGTLTDVEAGAPLPVALQSSSPLAVVGGTRADASHSASTQVVCVQPVDAAGNVISGGGGGGGGAVPATLATVSLNLGLTAAGTNNNVVDTQGAGKQIAVVSYVIGIQSDDPGSIWSVTIKSLPGAAHFFEAARLLLPHMGNVALAGTVDAPLFVTPENDELNLRGALESGTATSANMFGSLTYYVIG